VLNQFLSSGTHLIAKGAITALGPLPVMVLRFAMASVAFLLVQRVLPGRVRLARADLGRVLLLGFLVVPVNQGCFLYGLQYTTATHASLLYALTPLVVLLLARRLLGETRVRDKLIGISTAFAGVVAILLERGLEHELTVAAGDGIILVAVVAWAAYTVLSKPLLERYPPVMVTSWVIVAGSLMFLPAAFLPGALPPASKLTAPVWGGLLYLAIGTSVIAYPLWLYALRRLEASRVAITANTQPVITGVLSWLIFGERFSAVFVLGAALVLAGVTWVESRGTR
jgi:drug/metabolite transporter (DMT)-like permease